MLGLVVLRDPERWFADFSARVTRYTEVLYEETCRRRHSVVE